MLELKNVSAGYGAQDKLHDISVGFDAGRIYGVVGRNGCGKSTLLKTCAGLLEARGSILLEGRELKRYAPIERAQLLSYLPQSRTTPGISVRRMVEHGRYPRLSSPRKLSDADKTAVETAMERMKLIHLAGESVSRLSGGEQQRVYLAMLLAQDTKYLLLDEPAAHMDIDYRLGLLQLLSQLKNEGKCIIMVLHDLPDALKYSDVLVPMEDGRVVQAAPPETVLANGTLERLFHVSIRTSGDEYVIEK